MEKEKNKLEHLIVTSIENPRADFYFVKFGLVKKNRILFEDFLQDFEKSFKKKGYRSNGFRGSLPTGNLLDDRQFPYSLGVDEAFYLVYPINSLGDDQGQFYLTIKLNPNHSYKEFIKSNLFEYFEKFKSK